MDSALINDLMLAFEMLSAREKKNNFKAYRFMQEIIDKLLLIRSQMAKKEGMTSK